MAFVYRYINSQGHRVYYGMVNGDSLKQLSNRIYQHTLEGFDPSWSIEYIDGLTRTDADLLETHFINTDSAHLMNKAKRQLGAISLKGVSFPPWRPFSDKSVTELYSKRKNSGNKRLGISFKGRQLQALPGGFPSVFNKGLSTREMHSRLLFSINAADRMISEMSKDGAPFDAENQEVWSACVALCMYNLAILDAEAEEEKDMEAEWETESWDEQ